MKRELRRRNSSEEGSLPLALMMVLILVTLTSMLIPAVITQNNSTRHEVFRVHALQAAQTGLQVALGQMRAAVDSSATGRGDITKLPCGTLSGDVNGSGASRYQVKILYFDTNPSGTTTTWQTANALSCTTGSGPVHVPSYAGLTAMGTDNATGAFGTSGDRTLTATYIVRSSNQNIPGGLVQTFHNPSDAGYVALCFDGGSDVPNTGALVKAAVCQANVPNQQKFSYTNTLNFVLNSSVVSGTNGMCIQADPHATLQVGVNLTMQPCVTSGASLYLQQWSFNDNSQIQAANSNGTLSDLCFRIPSADTAGTLVLGSVSAGTCTTWIPTAAVGAGMAGPDTNQIVNFKQFGRCLDLANFDLAEPLIAWPCKQTPQGTPGWNQRWIYNSVTKTLSTNVSNNITISYCAVSPAAGATGAAARIMVTPCSDPAGAIPLNEQWTSHVSSTDSYSTKYTFVDANGLCLTPSITDLYQTSNNTSFVVSSTCDGSLLQKWDADPNILQASPLRDANEK
jgi:hypothetical protein